MKKTVLSLSLALALLLPSAARAQDYQRKPPAAGEEVIVTQSTSGTELRGRIVELSKTTLAILVNGQRVDVPIDNVLRIDARTDSVKNGAAIGAVVTGVWAAIGCSLVGGDGGGNRAAYCVAGSLVYTGIGAFVGAGIDALHKGRTTIYSKPASVALAVAPNGKGARLQLKLSF
jgi:hypothetical protein